LVPSKFSTFSASGLSSYEAQSLHLLYGLDVAGRTLGPCCYLHEPKARFQVGRLIPLAWRVSHPLEAPGLAWRSGEPSQNPSTHGSGQRKRARATHALNSGLVRLPSPKPAFRTVASHLLQQLYFLPLSWVQRF